MAMRSLTRSSLSKIEFFHAPAGQKQGRQRLTTTFRGTSPFNFHGITSRECKRDTSGSIYAHCTPPSHIDFSFLNK